MNTLLMLIGSIVIVFLALNVVIFFAFRKWPERLLSQDQKSHINFFDRYDKELRPYVEDWFDLKSGEWQDFRKELRALSRTGNAHEEFTEFKHPMYVGNYFTFSDAGFRFGENQGPWPISVEFYNIFFFGNSTALNPGPNWMTIASLLQKEMENAQGKPVRVYNFGRGAYFSTQQKILFSQLLAKGCRPDMALFLDGLNEFYFPDGKPATYHMFARTLADAQRDTWEKIEMRYGLRPKWGLLAQFMATLPLNRALEALALSLSKPGNHLITTQKLHSATFDHLDEVIDRYLFNKREIELSAAEFGIQAVFVWQPIPGYKYDLSCHEALHPEGMGGHARSGPGYELMAEILKKRPAEPHFIWLADIQENRNEPLYVDSVHYTASFCRIIASCIATEIRQRGLVRCRVMREDVA